MQPLEPAIQSIEADDLRDGAPRRPIGRLVATAENPIPEGMEAGTVTTSDGAALRYAMCPAASGARGTVCILQGRGDFIERYFETAGDLSARGYAVALFDWRGQGGSSRLMRNRLKGHIGSFRQYQRDLAAFMTGVVLPDCPPPYVVLAHSTGGAVLLEALATRTWFTRAVITSPLLAVAGIPLPRWAIGLIARSAVTLGLSRVAAPGRARRPMRAADFPGNLLTSDETRYLRDCHTLEVAPALAVGRPTWGWLAAAMAAMRRLDRAAASAVLRTPVLMVGAGEDRIVSTEACRAYARRAPGVAAVVIDGARHEILMERDLFREQFWAAFDAFVDDAPLPQGLPIKAMASS